MTASANPSAYPIRALRDQVTALEAAITLTQADPKPKPVHRLRTSTRRIEALLALLDLLPGLPEHEKPARKAAKLLKKLRRAAGAVRDLDVQQDLIGQHASSGELHQDAKSLRKTLKQQRDREAAHLLHTLSKLQPKLAPRLETLLDTLAAAESLAVSSTELTTLTRDWYRHNTPATSPDTKEDPDHLHAIRKSAKLARYIAESAAPPPATGTGTGTRKTPAKTSSGPAHMAAEFEALQLSGGAWHDLLMLTGIARHHLGKRSLLTRHLEDACQRALQQYHRHLQHPPA